jgi:hypothetical protein
MRFQFLGWFVAATIILSSGLSFVRRAQVLVIGLIGAVCLFAVAGALRNAEESTAELEQSAWERFAFAEDANMLDGFVLLRQVYPQMLGYSYGGEHLEILERPIPRAWWPDKPVGGYMNKLGIITATAGSLSEFLPVSLVRFIRKADWLELSFYPLSTDSVLAASFLSARASSL